MTENISMPLYMAAISVAGGLLLLVGGGESLVKGAVGLARRLGMKPILIGLTVVAFGTSLPELFVSLTASIQGFPDIMVGNIIGSNIANIGLILGFCAIIAPLSVQLKEIRTELIMVICGSVALMVCSYYELFPRSVAAAFFIILITYTFFVCWNSSNNNIATKNITKTGMKTSKVILFIVAGLILLSVGSNIFIIGAVDVARHFGISELVIGLTLAAIGTSLPELASSIAALRHKESGMLIGNVIGSNMFNLFMVLGLTGIIAPFTLSPTLLHRDLPIMLAFTLILIPILMGKGSTKRWQGMLLLSAYIGYCVSLL
jgi:cation:H+ antiporter